jgi:glycine dehydrogenase subunit 1
VQNPNFFGSIEAMSEAEKLAHANDAMFVVSFDPISLGLLKPPGEYDADIAVGEGQSLGIPMAFGGPGLGLFACKREFMRQMPGRVVGVTTELEHPELVEGASSPGRGYVLTLQTREQHIRREKATSNICTNQGLCALAATVYLTTLGKHGLRQVAELCVQKAHYLQKRGRIPFSRTKKKGCVPFFREFVIECSKPVAEINARLRERGIIGGLDLGRFYPDMRDHMLVCVTEKRTREEIDALAEVLR